MASRADRKLLRRWDRQRDDEDQDEYRDRIGNPPDHIIEAYEHGSADAEGAAEGEDGEGGGGTGGVAGGEDCSVNPNATEQPDGEGTSNSGDSLSYGSGDDDSLVSFAAAAPLRKRRKSSSQANGSKVQPAVATAKKAVADLNQLKRSHEKLTKMYETLDTKHNRFKREMLDGKKAAAREILQLKNDHKETIKMLKENSKLEIVALKKESKNSNDIALNKLKRGEL